VEFDGRLVNQIIGQHFYRRGLFELGDCFVDESQEPNAAALKAPLYEMYQNLEHLRAKNLEPALNWARKNRQTLEAKVRCLWQLFPHFFRLLLTRDECFCSQLICTLDLCAGIFLGVSVAPTAVCSCAKNQGA
jgi:hypothetical protein